MSSIQHMITTHRRPKSEIDQASKALYEAIRHNDRPALESWKAVFKKLYR